MSCELGKCVIQVGICPRSDRKALSGVSVWVDSTQSLVPGLYWKTSPWYNLNCTEGGCRICTPPESSRRLTVRAWFEYGTNVLDID